MFRRKNLKIAIKEVKSVKSLLKTMNNNLKLLSDKIDVQAEENKRWFYKFEKNMTRNLSKMDETVHKSTDSINVIIDKFMTGSQNMDSNQLRDIVDEAGALTEHIRSTSDVQLRDIPTEISNIDSSRSNTCEIIETVDSIHGRNLNTGNPSFDTLNTDISSTSVTNDLTRPQTSSVKNTMYQDQSSVTINSPNISDIPKNDNTSDPINTAIPLTSVTNYLTGPQTSSVKNTIYQDQSSLTINSSNIPDIPKNANISDTINTNIPSTSATYSTMSQTSPAQNILYEHQISSNVSNLSTSRTRCENANECETVPIVIPYIINTNREKELQEQDALRKKYRNKYKYLDKYKNISEKNSTQSENKNIKKTYITRSKVKNVTYLRSSDEPNSTQTFSYANKDIKDIGPYREAIYNGKEQVEIINVNGKDNSSKRVTKPVTTFQPHVLINANKAKIKPRLAKAGPKSYLIN